ncbi:hypothetical protein GJAV_G00179690 [Gymnothorax javanicus]|nr:hypothetical protein GJAV_G00179690 [Gymnothorax javanicus]
MGQEERCASERLLLNSDNKSNPSILYQTPVFTQEDCTSARPLGFQSLLGTGLQTVKLYFLSCQEVKCSDMNVT